MASFAQRFGVYIFNAGLGRGAVTLWYHYNHLGRHPEIIQAHTAPASKPRVLQQIVEKILFQVIEKLS
jgi:hypothetical protein